MNIEKKRNSLYISIFILFNLKRKYPEIGKIYVMTYSVMSLEMKDEYANESKIINIIKSNALCCLSNIKEVTPIVKITARA